MSEMIERMAAASYDWGHYRGAYAHLDEDGKNVMRARMRAVLVAMREPTEEMVCDGDEQIIAAISDHTFALRDPTPAVACWQAMIDAALKALVGAP